MQYLQSSRRYLGLRNKPFYFIKHCTKSKFCSNRGRYFIIFHKSPLFQHLQGFSWYITYSFYIKTSYIQSSCVVFSLFLDSLLIIIYFICSYIFFLIFFEKVLKSLYFSILLNFIDNKLYV